MAEEGSGRERTPERNIERLTGDKPDPSPPLPSPKAPAYLLAAGRVSPGNSALSFPYWALKEREAQLKQAGPLGCNAVLPSTKADPLHPASSPGCFRRLFIRHRLWVRPATFGNLLQPASQPAHPLPP